MQHTVSLKENRQFRRLYAKGQSAVMAPLVLYCRRNGLQKNRLGITVSTKIGKAVIRNRLRRRLRELYRIHEGELRGGYDIVLVGRMRGVHCSFSELERSFFKASQTCKLRKQTEIRGTEGKES